MIPKRFIAAAAVAAAADVYAGYPTAKQPYLDYATALWQGWPIAPASLKEHAAT